MVEGWKVAGRIEYERLFRMVVRHALVRTKFIEKKTSGRTQQQLSTNQQRQKKKKKAVGDLLFLIIILHKQYHVPVCYMKDGVETTSFCRPIYVYAWCDPKDDCSYKGRR